jgi:hypothetical protein
MTHSSNFEYAINYSEPTEDISSVGSEDMSTARVTLFFKSVRGLPDVNQYMSDSDKESIVDTFLLAFHIRDCRGGKGEREIGRRCLIWLFIKHPDLFSKVINLIPEYGRWDDLLQFFPGVIDLSTYFPENDNNIVIINTLQKKIVYLMSSKLKEDYSLMLAGKKCSLAAKWAPSEGDSNDKKSGVFKTLASAMNVSHRSLRKNYLTPLRSYIKIVECYMCDSKWSDIDYNNVPSCAMLRLKNSFEKHDEIRFQEWRDSLALNDPTVSKVNANQLQPHQLIKEIRCKQHSDAVCEAQWKNIEDECKKNGALDNDLVVVDTSQSMEDPNYLPLDVACAMGLLISKCSSGKFNNHVMSFNTEPKFHIIKDGSIQERYKQLSSIDWGGTTNILATFELILNRGKTFGLTQEDMPKRIWIISDMMFNSLMCKCQSHFDAIEKMYTDSGYTRPQIIFWNVNSSSDLPVSVDENGTAMISGFSPSIMKYILQDDIDFTPVGIMRKTLDSERLDLVRNALK